MKCERLRHIAEVRVSNVDKKSIEGQVPVLLCNYTDVYYNERITSAIDFMEATAAPGQVIAFRLSPGDVLITKDSETPDDIGVAAVVTEVPPRTLCGYHLAMLRPRAGVDGRFLRYALAASPMRADLSSRANGITRFGLRSGAIGDVEVPIGALSEQRAIADFLDRETARIDALVEKKLRLAELLAERRVALRDRVFMHAPGFRLKHLLAAPMAYGVLVPEFVDPGTGVSMIRTYNMNARGQIERTDLAEIPRSLANEYRRTRVAPGDVVLSVVGSMGRAAIVDADAGGFNLNRPLARLQPRPELPSTLLWHWTQTRGFMDLAALATGGSSAQPTLNLGDLSNFTVGLPADPSAWMALSVSLDRECNAVDREEDLVNRQVDLLREKRQALITVAVSGSADTRGAA